MKPIYEPEQAKKIVSRAKKIKQSHEARYRERREAILFNKELNDLMKRFEEYEI